MWCYKEQACVMSYKNEVKAITWRTVNVAVIRVATPCSLVKVNPSVDECTVTIEVASL
jgi:hypothetical protein